MATYNYYISQKTGLDANTGVGSWANAKLTLQSTLNQINTLTVAGTYIAATDIINLFIGGGEYTDVANTTGHVVKPTLNIIGIGHTRYTGNGTNTWLYAWDGTFFQNFTMNNIILENFKTTAYGVLIKRSNAIKGVIQNGVLKNLYLQFNGSSGGSQPSAYIRMLIENCTIRSNADSQSLTFDNCIIRNCVEINIQRGIGRYVKNSIIENSYITTPATNAELLIISNCTIKNIYIRFDEANSYALCNSATEIRAKYLIDKGIAHPTATAFDDNVFVGATGIINYTDVANKNYFPSNKTQYINNRASSCYRYATYIDSTKMNAPAGGSVASGYAVSTAAPGTGIEFVCNAIDFPSSQIIKKVHAIIDIGTGGEIMSSTTEDTNQRLLDVDLCYSATKTAAQLDLAPETYQNFKIGLNDSSTFNTIDKVAKSVKIKFKIKNEGASTDFGEVKVYQIIVETEDVMTFTNYTDINMVQYGNFYLMKEISAGVWYSPNSINLNPNNNVEIQALLDNYSGVAGRKTFTAQQLKNLASSSGGDIVLVWAEAIISGVSVFDMQTNLAKIETNTGKTIWSFEILT